MSAIASTAVEVFIFTRDQNMVRYLMLQRAPNGYLPGIWQGVTGRIEDNESAIEASVREVWEETSIRVKELWRIEHVSVYYAPSTDRVQCVPTFAVCLPSQLSPTLSTEHSAWEWVVYEVAYQRLPWLTSKKGLDICHKEIASVAVPNPLLRLLPAPEPQPTSHEGPV